jgi:hypothetical protein
MDGPIVFVRRVTIRKLGSNAAAGRTSRKNFGRPVMGFDPASHVESDALPGVHRSDACALNQGEKP